jgi:uncharacterized Zn finger protein
MCKHVAAVLYGVGARLDERPELLFQLRGVDHSELVCEEAAKEVAARRSAGARTLDESAVADVFGIEIDQTRNPAIRRPDAGADAARKTGVRKGAAGKRPVRRKAGAGNASRKKAAAVQPRGLTPRAKKPSKSKRPR